MNNQKERGMWKRTFQMFTKFKLPIPLYILQVILGVISTKLALVYVPYEADIKLGTFDRKAVYLYLGLLFISFLATLICRIPEFYADAIVKRNLQNKLIRHSLRLPLRTLEEGASRIVSCG